MNNLLQNLINRGDYIAIEDGKLVVKPASGQPVPLDWLASNQKNLIIEMIKQSGLEAYEFKEFRVGTYGKHRSDGVTLFFTNYLTGEKSYVVFNVLRDRKNGKGKLGKKQFRITENMALYKLYLKLLKKMPERKRLSEGHRLMSHFKDLVLTFDTKNDKIDKPTIKTLNFNPLNVNNMGYVWENIGKDVGSFSGNGSPAKQAAPTLTDKSNYVLLELRNKLVGNDVISNSLPTLNNSLRVSDNLKELYTKKRPEDQTVDEWLAEYDEARRHDKKQFLNYRSTLNSSFVKAKALNAEC